MSITAILAYSCMLASIKKSLNQPNSHNRSQSWDFQQNRGNKPPKFGFRMGTSSTSILCTQCDGRTTTSVRICSSGCSTIVVGCSSNRAWDSVCKQCGVTNICCSGGKYSSVHLGIHELFGSGITFSDPAITGAIFCKSTRAVERLIHGGIGTGSMRRKAKDVRKEGEKEKQYWSSGWCHKFPAITITKHTLLTESNRKYLQFGGLKISRERWDGAW